MPQTGKRSNTFAFAGAFLVASLFACVALAECTFDSGGTGSDGMFSPTANVIIPLPPDGVLNYTTVNIPSGVTVRFQRNATNTPAIILASGDFTITGATAAIALAPPIS